MLLSLVLGCTDPAADAPKAMVSPPVASVPQPAAPAPAAPGGSAVPAPTASGIRVGVEPAASSIRWTASKVTRSHDGGFQHFEGHLVLDGETPISTEFTIEMDSVTSDSEKLTRHLKNEDFFDVARFARARFVSTAIAPGGAEGATHTVTGTLDLHGVTRELSFPANIVVAADRVHATATFSIDRQDWGIAYAGKPDDLVRDDVLIKLDLRFPRT